ncbi:hypothetical protein Bca52824_020922 [Brassica carinata]|uniref:Uncharacterized protein n=1 Tax=Brassica carinata TaxID=52824 RepID=A0A8X8B022_BRACI|nr:hypothetical protein Bca52824_020922 [Brassica carinata]
MKETVCAKNKEPKPGCYRNVFAVLFRSSRWRQASKCKLHIQSLQCSVKVHRGRRECMVKQSRSDMAKLLDINNDILPEALPKAKQFYEDERRLSAYDQVEYFCTSMLQSFSLLNSQSDVHLLPKETKEAMAGLIFAASRIGELKELQIIRSLFAQRYGFGFDKDCVDLRPGHLLDDWVLCRIYKKQSSAEKQVYSNLMTSGREYSNNDDSSTSSSSHRYNDVLESLHEIDNRSLGFVAGSSNAPPHHSHRPSLTEQKTGFLNLDTEPSFDWPSYGVHNSVPELTPSHIVPSLRYGDGGGYFQSVKDE